MVRIKILHKREEVCQMSWKIAGDAYDALDILVNNGYITSKEGYKHIEEMCKREVNSADSMVYMWKQAKKIPTSKLPTISRIICDVMDTFTMKYETPRFPIWKWLGATSKRARIRSMPKEPRVLFSVELCNPKVSKELIPLIESLLHIAVYVGYSDANIQALELLKSIYVYRYYLQPNAEELTTLESVLTEANKYSSAEEIIKVYSDEERDWVSDNTTKVNQAALNRRIQEISLMTDISPEKKEFVQNLEDEMKKIDSDWEKAVMVEAMYSLIYFVCNDEFKKIITWHQ